MSDSGSTVRDRLTHMLSELLLLRPEEIRPESLLLRDLDVDSITLLELSFCIEKEFGVDFPAMKAGAETLGMLLPDALRTLEAMPGGTTFFEYLKEAVVRQMLVEAGTAEATTSLLGPDGRDQAFRQESVAGLARAVGSSIPSGLDGATPLASLRLSDLFDFLTVRALVGYVEHLLDIRGSRAA